MGNGQLDCFQQATKLEALQKNKMEDHLKTKAGLLRSTKLNVAISGGKAIGASKMLLVKGGDNVQADVFGRYTTVITGANTIVSNIASLLTSALTLSPNDETREIYNAVTNYLPASAAAIPAPSGTPKAYLCYLLLEKAGTTYTGKQFGYYSISTLALNAWQQLSLDVHVPNEVAEGIMYLYVANETNISAATSAYFDDFSIVHQSKTPALQVYQTSDYYPFGLNFHSYDAVRNYYESSAASVLDVLGNKKLFQDQEIQKGFDLGWYHYKYRMHDPALGRFSSIDPVSEKYLTTVSMRSVKID